MNNTTRTCEFPWSVCRSFVATATCTRGASCKYNHSLLDTSRIVSLVGDLSHLPPSSASTPATSTSAHSGSSWQEQTLFLAEYTKYSAQMDDTQAGGGASAARDATRWRMRLCGGGRATLNVGAESVSVQPAYPVKGQGLEAGVALASLEGRVFGRCAVPDFARHSLCRAYTQETCTWGATCRFSHTLFDTKRVEALLEEAVSERGYKEFRPLLEIEYIGRRNGAVGDLSCVWRVTLRCVLGYHQKATPQPVVVTSVDLNTAMRLLERQFAASSGRPQQPQKGKPASNAHPPQGSSSNASRRRNKHGRTSSAASNGSGTSEPLPSNRQHPHPPPRVPLPGGPGSSAASPCASGTVRNGPPPSYQDAMRGHYTPSTSPDVKRRL